MIPATSVSAVLPAPATSDPGFARGAAGVALLANYARRHGIAARSALAGTGLRAADLTPRGEVTAAQELRVLRNLVARLGDAIGPDVGRCYTPETFGVFGYALRASATVGDAVEVALRFIDLSHAFAIPTARIEGDRVVATLDGAGLPADLRRVLVARDATAVRGVLDSLVPGGVGASLRLDDERAELAFDVAELTRPLPRDAPGAHERSRVLCAEVVEPRRRRTGLAADVRVHVVQRLPDGAPMAAVAADLGLSERSLRRRLAAQGVGYRDLLDEVRSSLARELLAGATTLPVAELAVRLGYAEATSFIAAFRRWTGTTPAAFGRAARDVRGEFA